MAYIKNYQEPKDFVGKSVILEEQVGSIAGYFEVGSIVTIIGVSSRGYDFAEDDGNRVIEAGYPNFKVVCKEN